MDFWDFEDNQGAPKDPNQWRRVHRRFTRPVGSLGTVFDHQARFCSTWLYGWLYNKSLWFGVKNMVQHKTLNSGCWHLPPIFLNPFGSFWPMSDWQENLFGPREAGFLWWEWCWEQINHGRSPARNGRWVDVTGEQGLIELADQQADKTAFS